MSIKSQLDTYVMAVCSERGWNPKYGQRLSDGMVSPAPQECLAAAAHLTEEACGALLDRLRALEFYAKDEQFIRTLANVRAPGAF